MKEMSLAVDVGVLVSSLVSSEVTIYNMSYFQECYDRNRNTFDLGGGLKCKSLIISNKFFCILNILFSFTLLEASVSVYHPIDDTSDQLFVLCGTAVPPLHVRPLDTAQYEQSAYLAMTFYGSCVGP